MRGFLRFVVVLQEFPAAAVPGGVEHILDAQLDQDRSRIPEWSSVPAGVVLFSQPSIEQYQWCCFQPTCCGRSDVASTQEGMYQIVVEGGK